MALVDVNLDNDRKYGQPVVRHLPGEIAFHKQSGLTEPNACAASHIKAVKSDLDALNAMLQEGAEKSGNAASFREMSLSASDEQLIAESRAVVLECLPHIKRTGVAVALEEGLLDSEPVFDGRRTIVRERIGWRAWLKPSIPLLEVLRG